MAEKVLKSLQFPGLEDTYIIPYTGETGEFENSNIMNDTVTNKAVVPYSTASGTQCRAGIYGYRLLAVSINEDGTRSITVDDNNEDVDIKASEAYAVEDNLCFDGKSHYYNDLTIIGFDIDSTSQNTIIIVSVDEETIKPESIVPEELTNPNEFPDAAENWVWVPEKPDHGVPMLGSWGAYASGIGSIAVGYTAVAIGRENKALGNYAYAVGRENTALYAGYAEGRNNIASGENSHTEGAYTVASGVSAHAEGTSTKATGKRSHAEGNSTEASGDQSHAEGNKTLASGHYSHAEGASTIAEGRYAHAEGSASIASGDIAHAEGRKTTASGYYAHAEGNESTASATASHVEGYGTIASSAYQHVQGKYNIEDKANKYAHIIGGGSSSSRKNIHTTDWNGNTWFSGNVKIGGTGYDDVNAVELAKKSDVPTVYDWATAETKPKYSADEIKNNVGRKSATGGEAFNHESNDASGSNSHAEGAYTVASGKQSHAEGHTSHATADHSHAEGKSTTASAYAAHAEGSNTTAFGKYSHSEGSVTKAIGSATHAEGNNTIATTDYQHVQGKYNIADVVRDANGNMLDANGNIVTDVTLAKPGNTYAHILGNGKKEDVYDDNGNLITQNRSNAHTIDWQGNAWFAGDITIGPDKAKLISSGKTIDDCNKAIETGWYNVIAENEYSGNTPVEYNEDYSPDGYKSGWLFVDSSSKDFIKQDYYAQHPRHYYSRKIKHFTRSFSNIDKQWSDWTRIKDFYSFAETVNWNGCLENGFYEGSQNGPINNKSYQGIVICDSTYRVTQIVWENLYDVLTTPKQYIRHGSPEDMVGGMIWGKWQEVGQSTSSSPVAGFIESTEYPGCYYRMVTDKTVRWVEDNYEIYEYEREEWINPPLEPGEEYRTIERYRGKPVYVMMVDFGKLPNKSEKFVVIGKPEEYYYGYYTTGWTTELTLTPFYYSIESKLFIDVYEETVEMPNRGISEYGVVANQWSESEPYVYIKTEDFKSLDNHEGHDYNDLQARMLVKYYKGGYYH